MEINQELINTLYNQLFLYSRVKTIGIIRTILHDHTSNISPVVLGKETHLTVGQAQQFIATLQILGLVESGKILMPNQIGLSRFENKLRKRHSNTVTPDDFITRTKKLIAQQMYAPQLDRIYSNSTDSFRERADQVIKKFAEIQSPTTFVTVLAFLCRQPSKMPNADFFSHFGNRLPHNILTFLRYIGIIDIENGEVVVNSMLLHRTISLMVRVGQRNNNRLLSSDIQEIIGQQVFRGYTRNNYTETH